MATEAGIPSQELELAFAEGLRARQAAAETMQAKATSLLGRPPSIEPSLGKEPVLELYRLAAAAAANSSPDALHYAEAARSAGASEAAIDVTIGIARSVRSKALGFSDEEIGASGSQGTPCPTEASRASGDSGRSGHARHRGEEGGCACE